MLGFGTDIISSSTGFVLAQNGSSAFAHAFSTKFSSTGLAMVAGMFEPSSNLHEYPSRITLSGARVNLPILAIYLLSVTCLAALCAYIGLASRRPPRGSGLRTEGGENVSAVELAAMRLTTPGTLVQQAFPAPDGSRTAALKESDMFKEEFLEPARLKVGVLTGSTTFGVTRRRWGVAELKGQAVD